MAKSQVETTITKERVKIYAISKKYKNKPFFSAAPWKDSEQRFLTGVEIIKGDNLPLVIVPEKNYPIKNNDELILEKKGDVYLITKDYILYNFYKCLLEVANSKKEIIDSESLFYMENIEEEAKGVVKIAKTRSKAYAKMVELVTLKDMTDMIYFFGDNAFNLSQDRAEALLYKKCDDEPEKILAYFDDLENSRKITFIKKLLSHGDLSRASNGYIMYNQVVLGANEMEAAAFVYNDKNNAIYIPLQDTLNKFEGNK